MPTNSKYVFERFKLSLGPDANQKTSPPAYVRALCRLDVSYAFFFPVRDYVIDPVFERLNTGSAFEA